MRMKGKKSTLENVILMTARLTIVAYGYAHFAFRGGAEGDVGVTNLFLLLIICLLVMMVWPLLERIESAVSDDTPE